MINQKCKISIISIIIIGSSFIACHFPELNNKNVEPKPDGKKVAKYHLKFSPEQVAGVKIRPKTKATEVKSVKIEIGTALGMSPDMIDKQINEATQTNIKERHPDMIDGKYRYYKFLRVVPNYYGMADGNPIYMVQNEKENEVDFPDRFFWGIKSSDDLGLCNWLRKHYNLQIENTASITYYIQESGKTYIYEIEIYPIKNNEWNLSAFLKEID